MQHSSKTPQPQNIPVPAVRFDEQDELIITASPQSSHHDFDFYQGHWKIDNLKLKSRLEGCTEWEPFEATGQMQIVLNGLGNTDRFMARIHNEPFEGMTLRLFSPHTKCWSIYWADSNHGKLDPPVMGSFENKTGHFFCKDIFNGIPIVVVFRWDARDENNPVWSQAFSADRGQTWEWNWYMYMHRLQA